MVVVIAARGGCVGEERFDEKVVVETPAVGLFDGESPFEERGLQPLRRLDSRDSTGGLPFVIADPSAKGGSDLQGQASPILFPGLGLDESVDSAPPDIVNGLG
jgi:hypothetical protein